MGSYEIGFNTFVIRCNVVDDVLVAQLVSIGHSNVCKGVGELICVLNTGGLVEWVKRDARMECLVTKNVVLNVVVEDLYD